MRVNVIYFLLMGLLAGCTGPEIVPGDYAIENVNVITMTEDGDPLQNRTVVISGDRITRIAENGQIQVPDSAQLIDGNGGYLIPGLAEMHAHIPSGDADREYIEDVLFLYLANGITTIRGMLGAPLHLELREQTARDELLSPRIYTSGPGFSGGTVENPEQARARVREQYEAGYNFLKIFPGLSLEEYNAIADEANQLGIEFSGHIPASVGLQRALEAGQTTIDHLDKYPEALVPDTNDISDIENPGVIYFGMHLVPEVDRGRLADVARMTAEAGAWNVPSQALLEHVLGPQEAELLAERPEFRYMPNETVQQWIESKNSITGNEAYSDSLAAEYLQLRREIIAALHDAGAGLLLGSDAPQIFNVPGFSLHRELQYIVEAGLTPREAIQTGTVNVARYLDDQRNSGTIEEGKVADMMLLEANPLADIGNTGTITGVMYRGNWLGQEEIENRLQSIAEKYGN
ncbi:MAG: amidohydrolase family protein [Balneolaceae bacterium]|nr:amidohydrolase family protein [Balneolaceae bacterium]